MRTSLAPAVVAFATALAAGSALAQSNPITRAIAPGPQAEGFFRPTPDGDPSLTKYRPPANAAIQSSRPAASAAIPVSAPVVPAAALPAAASSAAAIPAPPVARGPDSNPASAPAAIEAQRWTEEQLDRTEREAERDRVRAAATPPPVSPGAYDGTTSERNR